MDWYPLLTYNFAILAGEQNESKRPRYKDTASCRWWSAQAFWGQNAARKRHSKKSFWCRGLNWMLAKMVKKNMTEICIQIQLDWTYFKIQQFYFSPLFLDSAFFCNTRYDRQEYTSQVRPALRRRWRAFGGSAKSRADTAQSSSSGCEANSSSGFMVPCKNGWYNIYVIHTNEI